MYKRGYTFSLSVASTRLFYFPSETAKSKRILPAKIVMTVVVRISPRFHSNLPSLRKLHLLLPHPLLPPPPPPHHRPRGKGAAHRSAWKRALSGTSFPQLWPPSLTAANETAPRGTSPNAARGAIWRRVLYARATLYSAAAGRP